MKLTNEEIQEVLKALLGQATEEFGDNTQTQYGLKAVQQYNELIRKYRDKLYD